MVLLESMARNLYLSGQISNKMRGTPKLEFKNDREALSMKLSILAKKYFGILTYHASDKTIDKYQTMLRMIVKHQGVSQQDLANMTDVDKSSIVRIVDYLESKGLVERKENPDDRRAYLITPTSKAYAVAESMGRDYQMVNDWAFKGFSKTEREVFYTMLERISQNIMPIPSDQYIVQYLKTLGKLDDEK